MGDPAPPEEAPGRPAPSPAGVFLTGVFQVAERMKKRRCALCPTGLECSVLYLAQSENLAAHENCLLYSSALVECENNSPDNSEKSFDVESVKKEVRRGRRLRCSFCGEKGATVGCDVKACFKNYHFVCAENDRAVFLNNTSQGTYKVFCREHAASGDPPDDSPRADIFHSHHDLMSSPRPGKKEQKRKRGKKRRLLTGNHAQSPAAMAAKFLKQPKEEDGRGDTGSIDTTARAAFLKRCKEAGLLDNLFEEMSDKLRLTQERLMDETASESEYEEIGTSLFDCRLFTDTFVNFQAGIEDRLLQCEERRRQLEEEITLLQCLKQTLCSARGDGNAESSSTSMSSLSLVNVHFLSRSQAWDED